jgi:HAD superfamily hydrolase (TIGR01509 family)
MGGRGIQAAAVGGTDEGALPSVRGLVFDLAGVLYDATVWRRWLVQVLTRMGHPVEYTNFYRDWDARFQGDVYRGHREHGEAFAAFLHATGLTRGQIDEIEAASAAQRRDLEATVRPAPGVRPTLARLQTAGIAVAVLANSEHPAARLRERLGRLGLGCHIAAVVSSIDLERARPDPACYEAVLAALRLPACDVAFLGCEAAELDAAARAGMPTIAFNDQPRAAADRHIERFPELLRVLGADDALAAAG